MKRTNPLLFRLGYSKNWLNHLNSFNYKQAFPVVLTSGVYFFRWLKKIALSQKFSIFTPVAVRVFVNGNILNLYLRYFFISRGFTLKRNVRFFRKKSTIKIKKFGRYLKWPSFFILARLFAKFETFYWTRFGVLLRIRAFNLYKIFLTDATLNFVRGLTAHISWKGANVRTAVQLATHAFYYRDPTLLGIFIAREFHLRKKHYTTLNFLTYLFSSLLRVTKRTKGLLLRISGRWNGANRSKTKILAFGQSFSLQTLTEDLRYCYTSAVSRSGVFGIKIWLL